MSKSKARRLLPGLAAAALGLALLAGPAGTPSLAETAPLAKADVEKIVRDYLLENPEVIREALEELERRDIAKADEARAQTLSSVSDILFNSTRRSSLAIRTATSRWSSSSTTIAATASAPWPTWTVC